MTRFGLVGGVVRGETIHMKCATEEDAGLTWVRFFTRSTLTRDQAATPCARCGEPIGQLESDDDNE